MEQERGAVQISDKQMSLIFEPDRLDGMSMAERAKALLALTQILMQAAGLVVEEFGHDQH
jgi:hypothetical protein